MAEEVRPIIKVEVGDSEKSVKGLKKEISDLRDKILNLTKGTDEYNEAVEQLQQNQRDLDNVMALTKKNATALEGSYDALTHQMAQLKKEWRATADEARRADLGKQIDEINNQLKELDASTGNFQRNVGNYVSHWEGMPEVTKDFGTAMREMNESIEPTKQKFEAVGKISSGLASGFAVVQGSMALLGVESESLEKTFVKLQAAMALMQGVKGLGDLVEGVGKARVAFKNFGGEVSIVSKLLGGGGGTAAGGSLVAGCAAAVAAFALVVAAAIAVAGNMDKIKQKLVGFSEADEAAIAAAKLNTELTKLSSQSASEKIVRLKQLSDGYKQLGDNLNSKKKFVNEFADELAEMGIKMTDVNDADKIFIEQTDKYVNALMARAKANAIKDKATEDYKKYLENEAVLEEQLADAIAKRNAGTPDLGFWNSLGQAIVMGSNSEKAAPIETNTQLVNDWSDDIANENVAAAQKALNDAKTAADKALKDAFSAAKLLEEEADAYLTITDDKKGNNSETKTKTADEIRDELVANFLNEPIEIEDVPIEIEDVEFDFDDKGGLYEKLANNRIASIERVAQRELELNKASDLSEEEKAQKELEIKQRLEEEKLRILQEYKTKAKEADDWQSDLELQQDIADQEVAITVAKNEKIIQSEQQRKEKTQKILGDVTESLAAAGQLTQGIMEIAQAKAEEDGEISEQEAKKIKGLQYATASINMLQGAITAFSSAMQLGPIIGPILGGVNAAAVIAMGTANLMKIKNTDITGAASSGAQAAVTPSSNVFGTDIPFSYTKQVTGASEVDALNQDTRVVILESDIQESLKRVSVRENESSF